MSEPSQSRFDEGTTFWGFLIGIIAGAIYTLFHIRQSGRELRQSILSHTLDPKASVESSLEDGKMNARERLQTSGNRD